MPSPFAERLNGLFEVITAPDGRPYTNEAVISAIAAKGGPTVSKGYLSELRSGKKTNPTLKHIEALADFFQVDPSYFVGDQEYADKVAAQLSLLVAMRNAKVQSLALRASGMTPETIDAISRMMDIIRDLQQHPNPVPPDQSPG